MNNVDTSGDIKGGKVYIKRAGLMLTQNRRKEAPIDTTMMIARSVYGDLNQSDIITVKSQ